MATIDIVSETAIYWEFPAHGGGGRNIFVCTVKFDVQGAPASGGYIVQRVRRVEKITRRWKKDRLLATNQYWEAWQVNGAGGVITLIGKNSYHDKFEIGARAYDLYRNQGPGGPVRYRIHSKRDTKGVWKIEGRVYWVDYGDFNAAQWHANVPEAGNCLSRWKEPSSGRGLVDGATLGWPKMVRTYAGKWDNRMARGMRMKVSESIGYPNDGFRQMQTALWQGGCTLLPGSD